MATTSRPADPAEHLGASAGDGVVSDAFARIEVRGIDRIPEEERHGRPRELFWVWSAANTTYLYFVLGGTLVLLGLGLWTSLAVVVLGNLFWLGVGWLATSGPASGTPSVVVTRAQYGVVGNRVFSAGVGWVIAITYEAVNLALGALAAFSLAAFLGWDMGPLAEVAVLLVVAVCTFSISIYGHATIVRLSPWFTGGLAVVIAVLGGYVLAGADWSYTAPDLAGREELVAASIGFVIIASTPLSWLTGADYARYLPAGTPRRQVLGWTAAGGLLPAVAIAALGVLAGTAIDMTDPAAAVVDLVPGWFYGVFLAAVVVGSITNNVLTAYSSGLCLQAMGVRASRARTVLLDGVIGSAVASWAVLSGDFLETVSSLLQFTVVVLAPSMAVYATDVALRRGRYDGVLLHREERGGPLWGRRGFDPAGLAATVVGVTLSLLCVNTTLWVAPIATALGGVDLSVLLGPAAAAVVYAVVFVRRDRVR